MPRARRGRRRPVVVALAVLAVLAAVVTILWFSLSARGGGVAGDAADGASTVVRSVEEVLDRNLVDRSDIPWRTDEVAHLLGWGAVTLAAGLAFRRFLDLSDIAVGVFASSVAIELMQHWFTSSRSMDAEDITANALGVMLALMVLVAIGRLAPARTSR